MNNSTIILYPFNYTLSASITHSHVHAVVEVGSSQTLHRKDRLSFIRLVENDFIHDQSGVSPGCLQCASEIVSILSAERVLHVSPSTLHDFCLVVLTILYQVVSVKCHNSRILFVILLFFVTFVGINLSVILVTLRFMMQRYYILQHYQRNY